MLRFFCATLSVLGLIFGGENPTLLSGGGGEPRRAKACLACHRIPAALSHPIGVSAGRNTGLPLRASGQMDCLTCHDERTLSPEHREDRAGTAFLRRDPRSLCSSCHRPRLPPDSVVAHGLEIGRAHLGTRQPEPEGKLDRASRGCLACHDGTVARAPRIEIGASSLSGWNGPHPIGVRYARAGSSALRNRAFLPAAIRLPDGRVACSSCHSVYARGENMLVLPRTESRLCLACHSK